MTIWECVRSEKIRCRIRIFRGSLEEGLAGGCQFVALHIMSRCQVTRDVAWGHSRAKIICHFDPAAASERVSTVASGDVE